MEPLAKPIFDLSDPASAYVFAFMQADGHHRALSRNRGYVSIEIKAQDADLLRAMQKVIPWRTSLTFRTRATNFSASSEQATLRLFALEARQQLLALGLPVGRKGAIIVLPAEPFSHRDYKRGLVDADGSVGFSQAEQARRRGEPNDRERSCSTLCSLAVPRRMYRTRSKARGRTSRGSMGTTPWHALEEHAKAMERRGGCDCAATAGSRGRPATRSHNEECASAAVATAARRERRVRPSPPCNSSIARPMCAAISQISRYHLRRLTLGQHFLRRLCSRTTARPGAGCARKTEGAGEKGKCVTASDWWVAEADRSLPR
jgi:hypothetical protein